MLHQDRRRAESFGADAESYHAARPSYPDALIEALLVDPPVQQVLDVGCGTGIASAPFLARGAEVTGVEPDARMAAVAAAHGVRTEVAHFETWDPAGRTFDLVVCAQAWHWLDPDAAARRAATVLRPGGRLGVCWNFGRPSGALREAFAPAYAEEPELERHSVLMGYDDDRLDVTARAIDASGAYAGLERRVWRWTRRYAGEEWLRHLFTHSDHAVLPPERRAALESRVRGVLATLGGAVDMDYDAWLLTARRR
jgi:SAM-dependent methyltransferase